MDLITPSFGLIVWTSAIFIILLVALRILAWKPILKAVDERQQSIEAALAEAERARGETARLKADGERILKETRAERNALLMRANAIRDKVISQAQEAAKKEGERIIEQARAKIQNEKMLALTELKDQAGDLSIEIAKKILSAELGDEEKQRALVSRLIRGLQTN